MPLEYPPERTSRLPASHPRSSPRALCLLHPDVSGRADWAQADGQQARLGEPTAGLAAGFGTGRRASAPATLRLARETPVLCAWFVQRRLGSTGLAFRLAALALQNLAPRLDPALDLPLGEQQWLLELWSCGDRLTHFQRLGLAPTRDPAAIRRAFLGTCQRLHPDRYYGKHIGRFARVLVDLFHRAHAAHACLADPRSCARYLTQLVDAGHTLPDEALAPRDDVELPLELQRRSA
ncbi:MAG: J domain-containing protein [Myxococcales bacterium]|nr:J domain-containing protein [Myxococcales bacterium]